MADRRKEVSCARCGVAPRVTPSYCRECRNRLSAESYYRHRPKRQCAMRRRNTRNRDVARAACALYYRRHRAELTAAARRRYAAERERMQVEARERRRRRKLGIPLRCPACQRARIPLHDFHGIHLCGWCEIAAAIGLLSAVAQRVTLRDGHGRAHVELVERRIHVCRAGPRCECGRLLVRPMRPGERST